MIQPPFPYGLISYCVNYGASCDDFDRRFWPDRTARNVPHVFSDDGFPPRTEILEPVFDQPRARQLSRPLRPDLFHHNVVWAETLRFQERQFICGEHGFRPPRALPQKQYGIRIRLESAGRVGGHQKARPWVRLSAH